eukprot:3798650-Pyramimonas_sp.AAC.1
MCSMSLAADSVRFHSRCATSVFSSSASTRPRQVTVCAGECSCSSPPTLVAAGAVHCLRFVFGWQPSFVNRVFCWKDNDRLWDWYGIVWVNIGQAGAVPKRQCGLMCPLSKEEKARLVSDSFDPEHREWDTYFPTGVFYGITTNPTILKRDGIICDVPHLRQLAEDAFRCGAQELLMQAWGETPEEMAEVGYKLAGIDQVLRRINIKCPLTKTGVEHSCLHDIVSSLVGASVFTHRSALYRSVLRCTERYAVCGGYASAEERGHNADSMLCNPPGVQLAPFPTQLAIPTSEQATKRVAVYHRARHNTTPSMRHATY